MRVDFPQRFRFLFTDSRYKVVYGGRGKGASWNIARALLLLSSNRRLRILCCREVQRSIKESVHQLLHEQIDLLGLSDQFTVQDTTILQHKTGSEFFFEGLREHTVMSIKSYESIDIAWVAEGQSVSKKSWEILIPTVRKEGSEIWIDMNPELDTDDTYQRFVVKPPPTAQVVYLTYKDNPYFTSVLEAERAYCEQHYPDDYPNIWLGEPRSTVAGAIYAREVAELLKDRRLTLCPYDPALRVHSVWDMGWNDATAIILVQRRLSECRIIGYYEDSLKRVDEWGATLNALPYNWGYDWLPHDAFTTARQTGRTDAAVLKAMGRKVERVRPLKSQEIDVETGIRMTRRMFPSVYLNERGPGADRLLECWKRYRRAIPKTANEPAKPIHDEYSHGADATRYLAQVIDRLSNELELPPIPVSRRTHFDPMLGPLGA